jgi:hypothetical protein
MFPSEDGSVDLLSTNRYSLTTLTDYQPRGEKIHKNLCKPSVPQSENNVKNRGRNCEELRDRFYSGPASGTAKEPTKKNVEIFWFSHLLKNSTVDKKPCVFILRTWW